MEENQEKRPLWQWLLLALLIIGVVYLFFYLFALGRNQSGGPLMPTLTPEEEITPIASPTPETTPTPSAPSPSPTLSETPRTGI